MRRDVVGEGKEVGEGDHDGVAEAAVVGGVLDLFGEEVGGVDDAVNVGHGGVLDSVGLVHPVFTEVNVLGALISKGGGPVDGRLVIVEDGSGWHPLAPW